MDSIAFGVITHIDKDRDYSRYESRAQLLLAQKHFGCISLEEDIVNDWLDGLASMPSYVNHIKSGFQGISPFGVTLIPPKSVSLLQAAIENSIHAQKPPVQKLIKLCKKARAGKKYMIVFGA